MHPFAVQELADFREQVEVDGFAQKIRIAALNPEAAAAAVADTYAPALVVEVAHCSIPVDDVPWRVDGGVRNRKTVVVGLLVENLDDHITAGGFGSKEGKVLTPPPWLARIRYAR